MSTFRVIYDDVFHQYAIQAEAFSQREKEYIGEGVSYLSLDNQNNDLPERLRKFLEKSIPQEDEERRRHIIISVHDGYIAFNHLLPEHLSLFAKIFKVQLDTSSL